MWLTFESRVAASVRRQMQKAGHKVSSEGLRGVIYSPDFARRLASAAQPDASLDTELARQILPPHSEDPDALESPNRGHPPIKPTHAHAFGSEPDGGEQAVEVSRTVMVLHLPVGSRPENRPCAGDRSTPGWHGVIPPIKRGSATADGSRPRFRGGGSAREGLHSEAASA